MLYMLIIFIAAACITGLLGLGMQLIWSGLCGKSIDRHPLCGKCDFDLFGHAKRPNRCPECGSTIARAGGIQIGHSKLQVPKIVHGSILVVINLSIVGFCWLTAEQPASANSAAIIPTARKVPISPAVSFISHTPLEVKTANSSIEVTDPYATISSRLTILSENNGLANSITFDQLLLFDKQDKLLGLTAQPASGVIEAHIHKGVIGMAQRSIVRGRGITARHSTYGNERKNLSQRGR